MDDSIRRPDAHYVAASDGELRRHGRRRKLTVRAFVVHIHEQRQDRVLRRGVWLAFRPCAPGIYLVQRSDNRNGRQVHGGKRRSSVIQDRLEPVSPRAFRASGLHNKCGGGLKDWMDLADAHI